MPKEYMCTKEEVKEVVHAELKQFVPDLVSQAIAKKLTRFLYTFWATLIGLIVLGLGAWWSLYYQVQAQGDVLNVGDRFTQEEHDAYARAEREYVDSRLNNIQTQVSQNRDIVEAAVARIEKSVSRIEDRLFD